MKTTATVLGVLLLGSMTLNYWLWRENEQQQQYADCFITRGFESQATISNELANQFCRAYKDSLTDRDSILGGIITRSAFDEILCTPECNAISYRFATDAEGGYGPGGNGVFVIFSGLNVKYNDATRTYEYKDLRINKYITRRWCPPTCNPY